MTPERSRSLRWIVTLGAVLAAAVFSLVNARRYVEQEKLLNAAVRSRGALVETLSLMKDAETGTRGFLLTGNDSFLEPFETALAKVQPALLDVERLGREDAEQLPRAREVARLCQQKLAMLGRLIAKKRSDKVIDPESVVLLERGKVVMDTLRGEITAMVARADDVVAERKREAAEAALYLEVGLGGALAIAVLLILVALSDARREARRAGELNELLKRDVDAREQAELRLRDQTDLLESVLANIGDAVLVVDRDRRVLMVNPAARKIASYDVGLQLSPEWSRQIETYLPDGKTRFPPERGPLTTALRDGTSSDNVHMMIRVPTGDLRTFSLTVRPIVHDGIPVAAVGVFRDMTDMQRAAAELVEKSQQLLLLSLRDELTGLHNRRGFVETAEHQLKSAVRAGEMSAVFFVDLNGMKQINDQLGHEMGDHALRAAAEILTVVFHPSDVVARLGGDEFAIFAGECDHLGAASVIDRIEHAVSEYNDTSGSPYRLSISAGAAVCDPSAPRDLPTLMQAADTSMYQAKRLRHARQSIRVRSRG